LIVDSVSEDASKNLGHGPNQHESSCASLLAVWPNSHKSNETHSSSLLLSQSEGAWFAPTTTFQAFKLIVASVSIADFLHSEGAEFALVTLQTFADEDQATPQSITSKLIVIYSNSKISIHFCKDCELCCEGVNAAMARPNGLFNHNLAFGLILAFGFMLAFGLNFAFGRNLTFSLITAFGHNLAFYLTMAFGLIMAFGRNLAFSLDLVFGLITAFGHNLAFGLTMTFGLIMVFSLFSFGSSALAALWLIVFVGLGLIDHNDLVSFIGLGLVSLAGCIDNISLIGPSSISGLVGFISPGLVGVVNYSGLNGLVSLVGLSATSALSAPLASVASVALPAKSALSALVG
jgi:hypothetical protein